MSSVDLRKWTASWAASEFALDHVTSAKELTHISGGNKQYYSLNQKPTREECPRKEPRELPFSSCPGCKVMELHMKIESMTLWSLTATIWKQIAILKLVIIFSFHSFEECKRVIWVAI